MMKTKKDLGEVYEWTGPTGKKFRDLRKASGAYYHDTTPEKVVEVLESVMHRRVRIRLFTGNIETGESWHDEYNVTGTVSTSMGPHKTPILVANSRSLGGFAILTDCIVRILVRDGSGFREAYRHPKYKVPKIEIKELLAHEIKDGYLAEASLDGKTHARFKSVAKAERWAQFMRGERFGK